MSIPRHQRLRRYIKGFVAAGLCGCLIALVHAGAPPNLLDDNRSDLTLEALETTAFNTAISLIGMPLNPLTFLYPPVVISGRVLSHPEIHNLYLDDDWNANNPDAPTRKSSMRSRRTWCPKGTSMRRTSTAWAAPSSPDRMAGAFSARRSNPGFGYAEFVELLEWVSCEAGFSPPVPGLIPPLTGVPQTNDNALYVIYLPRSVTIADGGCDSLSGYHFFSAAPNFTLDTSFIIPIPIFYSQTFAFAVIPTACAKGSDPKTIRDHITTAASHEILEAATDPLVGTGWINNSVITDVHGNFFTDLINEFSNVSTDLKVGEAGDICQLADNPQIGPPAFQHPTSPVDLPVSDASLGNSIRVAAYWSNTDNACAPFVPHSTLTFGSPHFGNFVTSNTPLTIDATIGGITRLRPFRTRVTRRERRLPLTRRRRRRCNSRSADRTARTKWTSSPPETTASGNFLNPARSSSTTRRRPSPSSRPRRRSTRTATR